MKLLSTSPNASCNRYWAVFKGIKWPRLVPRCFLFLGSLFRISSRIGLVDDCLTLLHKLYCYGLLWSRIFSRYSYSHRTLIETLSCSLVPSLWYSAPAMTYKKRYRFRIFLITLIYRPIFLLSLGFWEGWKISLLTYGFVCFWCI